MDAPSQFENAPAPGIPDIHENITFTNSDCIKRSTVAINYFRDHYFKGDMYQSINHFIRICEVCAAQFYISKGEKASHFVIVLQTTARDFFFYICTVTMTYKDMIHVIRNEFDSPTRRTTV